MNKLVKLLQSEPVSVAALAAAILTLLVTFNVIGSNSVNPVLGVVGAVIALAGGAVVRSKVSPVTTPDPPTFTCNYPAPK